MTIKTEIDHVYSRDKQRIILDIDSTGHPATTEEPYHVFGKLAGLFRQTGEKQPFDQGRNITGYLARVKDKISGKLVVKAEIHTPHSLKNIINSIMSSKPKNHLELSTD